MMRQTVIVLPCIGVLSLGLVGCQQDSPSHDEIIGGDLKEILELSGLSCDEVVAFSLDERLDYRIECDTGAVYRIHVSAVGHVNIKEHGE